MHETFEHTADMGLRVRADDLNALFVEAAQALFEAIAGDSSVIVAKRQVDITLAGQERDYLLFDWLKELLYFFDSELLLLSKFEVKITDDGLTGSGWGEPLDPIRHHLEHEVKAITY